MRAWSVSVAVSASQHRRPCLGPAQIDLPGDGGYVDRLSPDPVAGAAHEPAAGVPAGEALVGVFAVWVPPLSTVQPERSPVSNPAFESPCATNPGKSVA